MSGLTRRGALAGGIALVPAAAFADALDLALAAPASRTELFARMRGGAGEGWAVWLYSGVFLLKPEGQIAQKVCRIEGINFSRVIALAEGGYRYESEECGYWCDLASGQPLARLLNPVTGKTVTPRHYRSPQNTRFVDGRIEPLARGLPAGLYYDGQIAPPIRIGERVFITEDLFVKTPAMPGDGATPARLSRVQTSMATFASPAQALRRKTGFVPADFTYHTMNTFVPWLEMGVLAGVQNMRLAGGKFTDARAAPAWLMARLVADHPDFLTREGRRV